MMSKNNKRADYYSVNEWLPILKPLSAITDEDAIQIAKFIDNGFIVKNKTTVKRYDNHVSINTNECDEISVIKLQFGNGIIQFSYVCDYHDGGVLSCTDLKIFQFLISKGYDLPQYLLNNKTLFESGLCTYETN